MTRVVTDAAVMPAEHLHAHLNRAHTEDWALAFDDSCTVWPCNVGHDAVVAVHDALHRVTPGKYDHDHDES